MGLRHANKGFATKHGKSARAGSKTRREMLAGEQVGCSTLSHLVGTNMHAFSQQPPWEKDAAGRTGRRTGGTCYNTKDQPSWYLIRKELIKGINFLIRKEWLAGYKIVQQL